MKSLFIREQKRYTQRELCELMKCTAEDVVQIVCRLKEVGILKAVRDVHLQKDRSSLQDCEMEMVGVAESEDELLYVFVFVGIIVVSGIVLKCYPKYVLKEKAPKKHIKLVMKVLEKYNSKNQILRMFSGDSDTKKFELLAILWFLVMDYFENGSYMNTTDIIETNGAGEIIWNRTVNDTFTILSHNRPYYTELQTQKRIINDYDYFKRLHESVVSMAARELKEADLLDVFDISEIDISDEKLENFGETEYILYRLENELDMQFSTRKQMLLRALHAYIAHGGSLTNTDGISMFGTNSFNLVWEKICAEIFDNKLEMLLGEIDLPTSLCVGYDPKKRLVDLIEKPFWSVVGKVAKDTLVPDLISINSSEGNYQFIIFDAKYYVPTLNKGNAPKAQPGIESVTKQYLYQLAYQQFAMEHNFQTMKNCFLLPTEEREVINKGYVSMDMLGALGLEKICVRLIPVHKAYYCYLTDEKMDIDDLKLR